MKADLHTADPFRPAASLRLPDKLNDKAGSVFALRREVRNWMTQNTTHRWRVDSHSRKVLVEPKGAMRKLLEANGEKVPTMMQMVEIWSEVAFESDRDATLFKTFWL